MDTLIYVLVTLVLLGAVGYWFRGYWPGIRTNYARARGFWQLFQGLRGRSGPGRSGGQGGRFPGGSRVIDVEPTSVGPSSKAARKEQCRVCGDALSSAQLSALRQNDIRCTGSSRVGKACPYRNYN